MNLTPVAIVAAPRTGSTFIWQCATALLAKTNHIENFNRRWLQSSSVDWEIPHCHKSDFVTIDEGYYELDLELQDGSGSIKKTHGYCDCIITERNVIDSYLSYVRFIINDNNLFQKEINDKDKLLSQIDFYIEQLQYIDYIKKNYTGRILTLQYEKFESFFDIVLNDDIKTSIIKNSSREKNLKVQKESNTHNSIDKKILSHHIWSNKINYSKDILTKENYEILLEKFPKSIWIWETLNLP